MTMAGFWRTGFGHMEQAGSGELHLVAVQLSLQALDLVLLLLRLLLVRPSPLPALCMHSMFRLPDTADMHTLSSCVLINRLAWL